VTEGLDSWTHGQVRAGRVARSERAARYAELGSLLADLSRGRRKPVVRVHDRTHVEFAIDYRLASKEKAERFVWEAYYFVPESLRLDRRW